MAPTRLTRFLATAVAFAFLPVVLIAQGPPLPPEVGNAVVLATNSAQLDRDVQVISGDLVVNNAATGPILGEKQLSLDQGVVTPAGFALKADSVDIDGGAVVGGNVHYNVLQNNGTIAGSLITPLALPVIGTLPSLQAATAGTQNITVAAGTTQVIGTGNYGALVIQRDATVRIPGGPYTFTSITADRGASIIWEGPGELVVTGRVTLGADATIGVAPGVTTKHRMILVHGADAAVSFGRTNRISATVFAPNGSIDVGNGSTVLGSLVARDVHVGRDSSLQLRSGFRNLPPIAISQDVTVTGTSPVAITLNGVDPDNDPLIFTIAVPPSNGTLSAVTPNGPTSAVVVYTPSQPDPEDAFLFLVTDSEGFTGMGVVSINEGVPPAPPTTVIANDLAVDALADRPSIVTLPAVGPPGVAITLSIVAGTGPSHGTLGPLQQPTLMPQRPGSVIYVPTSGYTGLDAFTYQACGTVGGNPVCDQGTITLIVTPPQVEDPNLAEDFTVTAASNVTTAINLSPTPELPEGQALKKFHFATEASSLTPAAVAGNVADSNNDGFGDNHNALPGPVPGLMSAGVGLTGGAGSNGTVRMEFEWDISSLSSIVSTLQSATVVLHTNRGTTDSLDTFFYFVGTTGDGALSDSDYEQTAEPLRAVMHVPSAQPVGADGQFSFDVLQVVREALNAGFTHLALQGRVNETTAGPARGLQVYTTASGNGPKVPQLATTTAEAPARVYRVISLPANATLRDTNNVEISAVPYTLPNSFVFFRSTSGFVGTNTFNYDLTQALQTDVGTVTVLVHAGDCAVDPAFCDTGR